MHGHLNVHYFEHFNAFVYNVNTHKNLLTKNACCLYFVEVACMKTHLLSDDFTSSWIISEEVSLIRCHLTI